MTNAAITPTSEEHHQEHRDIRKWSTLERVFALEKHLGKYTLGEIRFGKFFQIESR